MNMEICTECGRPFTRRSNLLRHIELMHPKKHEHEEDSETGQSDDDESENETDESRDKSEDEDEDEEEEEEEEEEAEMYNLWAYLKDVATKDEAVIAQFEETKERLADPELSEDEVAEQARRVIRPEILKHIYEHYANFLKLWHYTKEDRYHKRIMKTKRKLMDEEDFLPAEAIEQAVKKRKYLIVKAADMLEADLSSKVPAPDIPEEEESENEED